jgi:hypothetical protein
MPSKARPKAAKRPSRAVKGKPPVTHGKRSAGQVGRSAANTSNGPGATAKQSVTAPSRDLTIGTRRPTPERPRPCLANSPPSSSRLFVDRIHERRRG